MVVRSLLAFAVLSFCGTAEADWMVRRQTMGGICHVQMKTASPIGSDLSGPHSTRKIACTSAKQLYDSSGTDSKRCAEYGNGTVSSCKQDGVSLP